MRLHALHLRILGRLQQWGFFGVEEAPHEDITIGFECSSLLLA
jgi:hypothetical protein